MDTLNIANTLTLYNSIITLDEWIKLMYEDITNASKNTLPEHTKWGKKKWKKMLTYFYIELANFPDKEEELRLWLVNSVNRHTGLSTASVRDLMNSNRQQVSKNPVKQVSYSSYNDTNNSEIVIIKAGSISTRISRHILEKNKAFDTVNQDDMTRLILRYYPLTLVDGFSWSIDQELYKFLQNTQLPVLEAFASPFNNNLPQYCSLFPEDYKFGSKGNFLQYIDMLDEPTRLIVNPPYTENMLNVVAKSVLRYVGRVSGSECILMYPFWEELDGIISLMNNDYVSYFVKKDKEYTIFSSREDKRLSTPMSIIFFLVSSRVSGGLDIDQIREVIDRVAIAHQKATDNARPKYSPSSEVVTNASMLYNIADINTVVGI